MGSLVDAPRAVRIVVDMRATRPDAGRSWMAADSVPFEVAESALAHSSAAVVAAYQREQLIELRRPIMEKWARFLSGVEPATAEVIPLRRA
jgi:hypothetical protein